MSLEPIALIVGGLLLVWLAVEAIFGFERGLRRSIDRFWAHLGLDAENPRFEILDRVETIFYGLVGLGLVMAGLARLGV